MSLQSVRHAAYQSREEDVDTLFKSEHRRVCRRTDKMIALIMCLQWPAAVAAAVWIAPNTWAGGTSSIHPHIFAAIYLGGLITIFPVALAFLHPGEKLTRHIIAACQMLMSAMLIHITGGRIETHFHIFGSLAFLSFYLDWPVLMTATIVTLLDHVGMGYFLPRDIFGSVTGGTWRLMEHSLWVVFCDTFLVSSCLQSLAALKGNAKREAEQIYQANHDALTGLGNRTLLETRLTALLEPQSESAPSFAVMAIDLDKVKQVNNGLGHLIAEQLLRAVAKRLQDQIAPRDTLIRMDGEKFVLLIPGCSQTVEAEKMAARLVDCTRAPFELGGHIISIGASIGISLYPEAGKDMRELLDHAELALHKTMEKGKNGYQLFDEQMREETLRQMSFEHSLQSSIYEQEFELHYQPLVSVTGSLLGFEALLRWNHPVLGRVPPSDFIPIAERTGLIIPLGKWVLEQACAQAAQWHRAGHHHARISVNVSSVQLAQTDFVQTVTSTLERTGLPPELLDLELTESMIIHNFEQTRQKLALLRQLGVRTSIDDFGTGYSSLNYLRELRVDTIKIDRSLVTDIEKSHEARLLIEGIIGMTHSLDLRVLAEGVENDEQLKILRHARCDEIQGYYFSKPVPVNDATRMLENIAGSISAFRTTESSHPAVGIMQVAAI